MDGWVVLGIFRIVLLLFLLLLLCFKMSESVQNKEQNKECQSKTLSKTILSIYFFFVLCLLLLTNFFPSSSHPGLCSVMFYVKRLELREPGEECHLQRQDAIFCQKPRVEPREHRPRETFWAARPPPSRHCKDPFPLLPPL